MICCLSLGFFLDKLEGAASELEAPAGKVDGCIDGWADVKGATPV